MNEPRFYRLSRDILYDSRFFALGSTLTFEGSLQAPIIEKNVVKYQFNVVAKVTGGVFTKGGVLC